MNNLDHEQLKKLNDEFDYINKETQTFLTSSYKLPYSNETIRRREYIDFILRYSRLSRSEIEGLELDQLYLVTLGIASGIKFLPLILLTYPRFTQQKLNGLIYILENKNVLNLVIEHLVFMEDEPFTEILNSLKQGKGCAQIINEIKETNTFENVFSMTNKLDDEFFCHLLDDMDLYESYSSEPYNTKSSKPKKGTAITFDLNKYKEFKEMQ